jgi:two-component system, LytTR family, sensor histidine kinase AlgZ
MHPLFASLRRLGLYLLAWILPAAMLIYILGVAAHLKVTDAILLCVPLCLVHAALCLSPWYMCRALPLRAGPTLSVLVQHLVACAIMALLWCQVAGLLARPLGIADRVAAQMPFLFGVGMLLYGLAVALHYTYIQIQSTREALSRQQTLRVLAREAELKALKAQVNPHFLFNCLNSISALTSVDPARAREMCVRLSDFLRSTLRLGEKVSIPFGDELALVRAYLDVEQVRFASRLRVEQNVDPACEQCVVAPLLLQPLVENAVKHGIASLVEGGFIRIRAWTADGLLRIVVENDFDPDSPPPRSSGMGLANVRNRVETGHGGRGHMHVAVEGTLHRVELALPCELAAARNEHVRN